MHLIKIQFPKPNSNLIICLNLNGEFVFILSKLIMLSVYLNYLNADLRIEHLLFNKRTKRKYNEKSRWCGSIESILVR